MEAFFKLQRIKHEPDAKLDTRQATKVPVWYELTLELL
jgi:hypothetical protein